MSPKAERNRERHLSLIVAALKKAFGYLYYAGTVLQRIKIELVTFALFLTFQ